MAPKQPVSTDKGVKMSVFSQAMIHNDTVYVSGNIGIDPQTMKVVEGSVGDRTRKALELMQVVLEEAGSSLQNVLKVNVYLTDMANFAAMNKVYTEVMPAPLPARTCVAVAQLPFGTDVEIECTAHL